MDEIKQQRVMVIFDGTTRVDEVFAIIFRWVIKEMIIYERCVEMGKYKHTFNHEELITAVIKILTKYNVFLGEANRGRVIRNGDIIGFQRDRCATNTCAVTILTKNSIGSRDMECLSHTMTHVGEHGKVPLLLKMKQDLCALTKESYALRDHWFKVMGTQFLHPGNTRWWSYYKLYCDLKDNWTLFLVFLHTAVVDGNVGENGSRIRRLLAIINNPVQLAWLKLELDVIVVTMRPFVQATYLLEGKGPCAIIAYDTIMRIDNWFLTHTTDMTFSNMEEAIQTCNDALTEANEESSEANITDLIRTKINPGYNHFKSRILEMLKEDVEIYKTIRYTNPVAMIKLKENFSIATFVKYVKDLLYFSSDDLNMMLVDLPEYLQSLDNIPADSWEADELTYATEYWKRNRLNYPGIAILARYSFTMITSSASAERAFSVLKRCFSSDQRLALEDYIMLSCMLQINRRNAE
jgi:hAT family C-terminal dimerisation region